MHDHTTHIRKAAAAVLTPALAALALAACGSSSNGTASKTSVATVPGTATASSPTPLPSASAASKRYEALRSCLARNGIHLPKPRAGTGTTSKALGTPPRGVSPARYEAALQKCGFGGNLPTTGQLGSQAVRTALQRYAECMRAEGIPLPQPGTTNTTAQPIDTHSAKFKAAAAKCAPFARGALAAPGAR